MANNNLDIPELSPEVAAELLQQVFEHCDMEPNTVPTEVLASYTDYRKERFTFQKGIAAVMLILFLLLPVAFIAPKYTLTQDADSTAGRPTYTVVVDNMMQVTGITAEIDGQAIPVFETEAHHYQLKPGVNGEMNVTVTLLNRQYLTQTITVEGVDMEAPKLLDTSKGSDSLTLLLEEDGSGIDWSGIYAESLSRDTLLPASYSEANCSVTFPFPEETVNIFIPDKAKNELQLIMSVE